MPGRFRFCQSSQACLVNLSCTSTTLFAATTAVVFVDDAGGYGGVPRRLAGSFVGSGFAWRNSELCGGQNGGSATKIGNWLA